MVFPCVIIILGLEIEIRLMRDEKKDLQILKICYEFVKIIKTLRGFLNPAAAQLPSSLKSITNPSKHNFFFFILHNLNQSP